MGYIGAHGVQALHRYKYSGVDHSYVAKYVLQPFWSRCVNFFPLWMPPNMITLTGFLFLVTSALLGYGLLFSILLNLYYCISSLFILLLSRYIIPQMGKQAIARRKELASFTPFFNCIIDSVTKYVEILSVLTGESTGTSVTVQHFIIYSPLLDSPPPRWVNFAHGLLLFLYQVIVIFAYSMAFERCNGELISEQLTNKFLWCCRLTFDAVDGKQARRTNSSSPLGELFDHGCDALACAFEALAFGSTAMCGRDTFWFWVISAVPFYFATWESYFTNTLVLPVVNGPTEGLMLIYLSHFFTALVGSEWWAQQFGKSMPLVSWVPYLNEIPTNRAVLLLMIAFAVIPTVYCNINNVHKVVQATKGSMPRALAMLYPFVVLLGGVLLWDYLSPSDLMKNYPHLVVIGTGLAFGFLVGRMILAHLCDEPKGLKTNMCMSLLCLPFAVANALTASLNDGVPMVDEFWVLLAYTSYSVSLYLHFATSVVHEITSALGIYCFRITRKEA